MSRRVFIAVFAAFCLTAPLLAQQPARIVVLGHIRGNWEGKLNYLLPKLVEDVRALRPDAVVITGDMIWGDWAQVADRARIVKQWEDLDRALECIGAPIYRVPGNHDLHDRVTRDVFRERYGELPRVESVAGCRLVLLNSCWTPEDGDARTSVAYRGVDLDARQIEFLETELASGDPARPTFVFLHHLLWWAGRSAWWRDVHPILVKGRVRAVFGGDNFPYKVSHFDRDGIDYMHCVLWTEAEPDVMRESEHWRMFSHQPDCYIVLTVDGETVKTDVRTIGILDTNNLSPERYWSVYASGTPWMNDQYARRFGSPRAAIAVVAITAGAAFAAGVVVTIVAAVFVRRRRRSSA